MYPIFKFHVGYILYFPFILVLVVECYFFKYFGIATMNNQDINYSGMNLHFRYPLMPKTDNIDNFVVVIIILKKNYTGFN